MTGPPISTPTVCQAALQSITRQKNCKNIALFNERYTVVTAYAGIPSRSMYGATFPLRVARQTGKISLPDLQRPFVWRNDRVRELLDSMLNGYPIGYIMLWESPSDYSEKVSSIGANAKIYEAPKELVIDGQQRLTALLSSLYGVAVKDKNFKERTIRIAFDPVARVFENADAATNRDPRFISSVSDAFAANRENMLSTFRKRYIRRLNESNVKKGDPELTDAQEDLIEQGINALLGLERYLLPTLEIASDADEEMVSDIFVRVNSQGQSLKQDDFIMTLLSVYEPEMRGRIERFCADSHIPTDGTSYNHLIKTSATHIIRAAVGLGFKRGRLRYAYQIIRGKNLKTGETAPETRAENFKTFGNALDRVIDLNNWKAFLNTLGEAGYISSSQITSENALIFNYTLYLIGRYEFGMAPLDIRRLIRRWFYASNLTAFYVSSSESDFERQLNEISQLKTSEEFTAYFDKSLAALMTEDYFSLTLPNVLDASEATGPSWQGFVAAQVVLGYKALFSTVPISHLISDGASGTKKAVNKHHLFPDHYLEERGYLSNRSNRANFTYADYGNNIYISDDAPSVYVTKYREELGEEAYKEACLQHTLPYDFEGMDYGEFLAKRRVLMAQLIKRGYERL